MPARFFHYLLSLIVIIPLHGVASDYGTTGLIDIPTARMRFDGDFTSTAAIQSSINAYAVSYQAFPWLEATFRYSGTANAANSAYTGYRYYDRNYEAKIKLWDESYYIPQVAIGIRDLVGTGKFGSEYLVANKKFDNFDFTLGLGWGRLAGNGDFSNPLKQLDASFASRTQDTGVGGEVSYKSFFSGERVGLFGGLSYRFNDLPVTAMVEYNPDQYEWEQSRGGFKPESPISYGLTWHALPGIDITLSHQHGQELGVALQATLSSSAPLPKPRESSFISAVDIPDEELPKGISKKRWYDMLLYDVERSGAFIISANIDKPRRTAEIVIANKDYAYLPDAIDRIHQFAEQHLPAYVQYVEYTIEEQGHLVSNVRMPRVSKSLVKDRATVKDNGYVASAKMPNPRSRKTNFVRDKITTEVSLDNRLMLFDPNNPLAYQFYAKLGTKIELPKRVQLHAAYALDLYNNFEGMNRVSNSVLPHVRSDSLRYMQEGKNGLEYLFLDKRGTLSPDLHYRAYGGVLETMYSGVGGELLYNPYRSRLAFGLSGNWVKQRDYDRSFSHLDYTTTTGFASLYWATPFYNYDAAVHVGQYLAKDVGATFEIRRTFNNGWMVGMWATLTDVPFDQFGEGSFDKGFFFRIPLANIFGSKTKSAITSRIRPIQRDGGARLEGFSGNIWWDIRDARFDVLKGGR